MTMQADRLVTVLDHIENISVDGNVFEQPANEYWALVCLRHGLEFLYIQAQRCDETIRHQLEPAGNIRLVGFGNLPEFDQIPKTLLTCAFQWYAVSACQYVRTVGAIAYRHDPSRPKPPAYVQSVIPEVLAFRDKVAAHFAWATANDKDTDAERLASILPPLGFQDDSIHVGGLTVAIRKGTKTSNSAVIKPWSISKVHEELRKRYWPQKQPDTPHPPAS